MPRFIGHAAMRLSVLVIAFGLALGVMASLPGSTLALPVDGLYNTKTCTYAGKEYSEGSRVKQGDGKVYKCEDGQWQPASIAPPDYGWDLAVPVYETAPVYALP